MSNPSELESGRPLRVALTLALALGMTLGMPLSAQCGVAAVDSPAPAPASDAARTGPYQIRCWQLGRLLFEENHVALPADLARQGVKLSATDRHGRPIYLTDTANATCLIRSGQDDERPWPREPREPRDLREPR